MVAVQCRGDSNNVLQKHHSLSMLLPSMLWIKKSVWLPVHDADDNDGDGDGLSSLVSYNILHFLVFSVLFSFIIRGN